MQRLTFFFALLILLAFPVSAQAKVIPSLHAEGALRNPNPAAREQTFVDMQQLGVRIARVTLSWHDVATACGETAKANPAVLQDPNNGCYNWGLYDDLVTRSKAHNIDLLFSVAYTPAWANNNQGIGYTADTQAEFDLFSLRYGQFAYAAGRRYPTVKYWTIWNEPNGSLFFRPARADMGKRYASLYVSGASSLKSANPSAMIAPGPTAPKPPAPGIKPATFIKIFQTELAKKNKGYLVSAWAHNPYPSAGKSPDIKAPGVGSLGIAKLPELIAILDQSPVTRNKPIWATEFAYETKPAEPRGVSEFLQAKYMADCYRMLWQAKRITIGSWYGLTDPADLVDWQSGLKANDGRQKLSWQMYQRPVSVYHAAKQIKIWGETNKAASATLIISTNGRDWQVLAGQNRSGNISTASWKQRPGNWYVAVKDSQGISGPAIAIK